MRFYERRNIVKAINSLHNTKMKWFSDETLYGSLLTTRLISHWYAELGLYHAAKYYAMITVFIALNSNKDSVKKFIHNGLFLLANHDYAIGYWYGFLDEFLLSIEYYNMFSDGTDQDNDLVDRSYYHLSILIWFVKNFSNKEIKEYVSEMEDKYPINEMTDLILQEIESNFSDNLDDIWPNLEKSIMGMPFSDCGISRNIVFKTFGIKWNINWKNDYNLNILSEQFISSLQIFLIDILKQDLCLIETNVEIEISSNSQSDEIIFNRKPSNKNSQWELLLPPTDKIKMSDFENKILEFLLEILQDVSLLNQKGLNEMIKITFNKGLATKLIFGGSYYKIYNSLFPESDLNKEVIFSKLPYSNKKNLTVPLSMKN
ncbi:hypothetical protein [Methanobrevibacter arboriphilus]|uniref:hypothetical protein n=1 Tax=Methanobrevibacter arboriphilus TaxID=39441 RepID=UPI000B2C7D7A|nr:hypothetical protein [Methanobrevibacter arboriphilus]